MKKQFILGWLGLILFEIANVYFIMPMPESQQMNSIALAYFLYRFRWMIRMAFVLLMLNGLLKGDWGKKWIPGLLIVLLGAAVYVLNFVMAADKMFLKPERIILKPVEENQVDTNRLVIGVLYNGESRAYPIRFLGYHHQVEDSIGDRMFLITYCTVCRTGRVYDPVINGKTEHFRLVGMDHFNAMLEDEKTKSWWRQSTGEAIAGELKGSMLPEYFSYQTSLGQWIKLHPETMIMQEDQAYTSFYPPSFQYESGESRNELTGTDTLSWQKKSWVIGVKVKNTKKAYDWNALKQKRIMQDKIENISIILVLSPDGKSFFAFEGNGANYEVHDDVIAQGEQLWRIDGRPIRAEQTLKPIQAYQEFWHSWSYFNGPNK